MMSHIEQGLKDDLTNLLDGCLRHLIAFGIVTEEQLRGRVRILWKRASVLGHRGHGASTTQDDAGKAVVYLDPSQQPQQLAWCIVHEATHVAQVCRGDLAFSREGIVWCGNRQVPCDAQDPAYKDQPWEIEAEEMVPRLILALRESDPTLGPLLDVLEKHQQSL